MRPGLPCFTYTKEHRKNRAALLRDLLVKLDGNWHLQKQDNSGYNKRAMGMTGFDGGGWSRIASREVPNSKNPHNNLSANNRTSYAAMPLAA